MEERPIRDRKLWTKAVLAVFAPTRCLYEYFEKDRDKAKLVAKWSRNFLISSIALALASSLVWRLGFIKAVQHQPRGCFVIWILLWFWPFSRTNEIFFAFGKDAFDRLDTADEESRTGIKTRQRLQYLLLSYLEVTVNFGIIFFFLPASWFCPSFKGVPEAIYFSAVTITTLGYDIFPKHPVSQFLCVYELAVAFTLVVLTIASYIARISKEKS